ncbi:Hypothetical predicted protein, partial [Olea europaea subsp. europaea]
PSRPTEYGMGRRHQNDSKCNCTGWVEDVKMIAIICSFRMNCSFLHRRIYEDGDSLKSKQLVTFKPETTASKRGSRFQESRPEKEKSRITRSFLM